MTPSDPTGSEPTISLAEAIRLVEQASSDEELFGHAHPHRRYRRLAAVLHPDRAAGADSVLRASANRAFVTLTTRWRERSTFMLRGYPLRAVRHAGDLANLYDVGADRLLKLPRDPANNDLMEREGAALARIADRSDPHHLPYVPRLVDTFRHRDRQTGADRRVNVLRTTPNLHSLAAVRAAHPGGLDPRDAAWMWRRLLVALGVAHRAGVVHGAVLPHHVLIEPAEHGVVLIDWCYSVIDRGDTVPAVVREYADWYPAEVRERRPAGPGTDIAMAARCMTQLMGVQAPGPLCSFAAGCALPRLQNRPYDAWRLLGELDEVLDRHLGPRTFRPFHL